MHYHGVKVNEWYTVLSASEKLQKFHLSKKHWVAEIIVSFTLSGHLVLLVALHMASARVWQVGNNGLFEYIVCCFPNIPVNKPHKANRCWTHSIRGDCHFHNLPVSLQRHLLPLLETECCATWTLVWLSKTTYYSYTSINHSSVSRELSCRTWENAVYSVCLGSQWCQNHQRWCARIGNLTWIVLIITVLWVVLIPMPDKITVT